MVKKLLLSIYRIFELLGKPYLALIFFKERKFPSFKRPNERPVEYAFAFQCIAKTYPSSLLDIGTGSSSFPHLVRGCGIPTTAIDKIDGYWQFGLTNRHYPISNDDITSPKLDQRFDMITCISTLEHIPDHNAALLGMSQLLKPGGYIVLSFPYNETHYERDVYRLPQAGYGQTHPFIGQIFSRQEVDAWCSAHGLVILDQEYYEAFTGELWTFGSAIHPLKKTTPEARHHLTCILLQKQLS
jgi:SAM-dependent methyltransferase